MSSPPSPRDFEGWIEEDWPGATKRPDVMAILEPYRETVTAALDDFEDDTMSWRSYCGTIYGYTLHEDGRVPHAVLAEVTRLMREPAPDAGALDVTGGYRDNPRREAKTVAATDEGGAHTALLFAEGDFHGTYALATLDEARAFVRGAGKGAEAYGCGDFAGYVWPEDEARMRECEDADAVASALTKVTP